MSNRNKRTLIYQVTGTRRFTAELLTIAFCGAPQMSISNGRDNEQELHFHNEKSAHQSAWSMNLQLYTMV